MATIVQNPDFGTGVGQAIGSGLSQAFQLLAQKKLKEMSRKETARGLQALGYNPEQALQLAHLDPSILREAIKQRGKEAETARFGEALSLLGGPSQEQPEQQLLQILQQPSIAEQPEQQLQKQAQPNIKDLLSAAGVYPQAPKPTPLIPQPKVETIKPALTTLSPTAQEMKQALPQLKTITPSDVARIAKQTKLTPQQYKDLNQIAQDNQKSQLAARKQQFLEEKETKKAEREESKERRLEQKEIDKETKPIYDEIVKSDKESKENDKRLDRIEVLTEKGNLGSPVANALVKTLSHGIFGFGLDLTALTTADAQELDKLSTDFVKSAKGIFGTRLTDTDLKTFMLTIPTLLQSNAGRKKVIRNLRIANQVNKLRFNTMKDIIKENNNVRPKHIELLIDERIEPQLDALANEFKSAPLGPEELKTPGVLSQVGRALGLYY